MLGLTLAIAAIAFPDSLNPSLIVAAVYMTLGPHPVRRSALFTLSAFVVTLACGLAVGLGLGDLILSLLPKVSRTVKYDIMIVIGVGLLCGAGFVWWRRTALGESEPPSTEERHGSGGSPILMGAGIAGLEFLTAFPYFAAIALIVGASVSGANKVALLVLYNVIYVLPLIAIVVLRVVMGEHADRVITPVGDWLAMKWPLIVAPLAAVVGVGLIAYGIIQLK